MIWGLVARIGLRVVGSKVFIPVVIALVAILIFYLMIQSIQEAERDKIEIEIQEREIIIRDEVDRGVRETPKDVDQIIDRLIERRNR